MCVVEFYGPSVGARRSAGVFLSPSVALNELELGTLARRLLRPLYGEGEKEILPGFACVRYYTVVF